MWGLYGVHVWGSIEGCVYGLAWDVCVWDVYILGGVYRGSAYVKVCMDVSGVCLQG